MSPINPINPTSPINPKSPKASLFCPGRAEARHEAGAWHHASDCEEELLGLGEIGLRVLGFGGLGFGVWV